MLACKPLEFCPVELSRFEPELGPEDRLVIQYLDLEQKSIAEISALTGWNQTLVKVRAFRARRKLQRHYRELTDSER